MKEKIMVAALWMGLMYNYAYAVTYEQNQEIAVQTAEDIRLEKQRVEKRLEDQRLEDERLEKQRVEQGIQDQRRDDAQYLQRLQDQRRDDARRQQQRFNDEAYNRQRNR